ncbi:MAG: NosD domain-containing protein [Candidatus Thorarchaeota archaeon]
MSTKFDSVIMIFLLIVSLAGISTQGFHPIREHFVIVNDCVQQQPSSQDEESIYIGQNSEFPLYSTSGNGTSANPYIIENLYLQDGNYITISMTSAYFVIRNCTIEGTGIAYWGYGSGFLYPVNGYGIRLSNVTNGYIQHCVIRSFSRAVLLDGSRYCTIEDSEFQEMGYGIDVAYSQFCDVTNTRIGDCMKGMTVLNSMMISAISNQFGVCSETGIHVGFSRDCHFIDNELENGSFTFEDDNEGYFENQILGNTNGGREIAYFFSYKDLEIQDGIYGQLIIAECSNLTLQVGEVWNGNLGISILNSNTCWIEGFQVKLCDMGIKIQQSENITLKECKVDAVEDGAYVRSSCGVSFINCEIQIGTQSFFSDGITVFDTPYFICERSSVSVNLELLSNSMSSDAESNRDFIIAKDDINQDYDPLFSPAPDYNKGIAVYSSNHSKIINNVISNFRTGISMSHCSHGFAVLNTILGTTHVGIQLSYCYNIYESKNIIIPLSGIVVIKEGVILPWLIVILFGGISIPLAFFSIIWMKESTRISKRSRREW